MNFIWNIWPMKYYAAIALPWGAYFNPKAKVTTQLRKHEEMHHTQMKRDGFLRFYISYVIQYAWNIVKYQNHWKAYESISYEVEARAAEWR